MNLQWFSGNEIRHHASVGGFYLWLYGGTVLYFGKLSLENALLFIYREAQQASLEDREEDKKC